jgi:protein dithiol oxidoreductase (disulfide-forming)
MIRKLTGLLSLLFLTTLLALPAGADTPTEGIDYQLIDPVPTEAEAGRVEVVELFWYGCPHCYNFEPHVQEWKAQQGENITFRYLPAVFNDLWAFHARVFYAAEHLGLLDTLHTPFFQAIHAQGRRMADERSVLRFVEQQGVDPAEFRQAMASDEVTGKVREAIQLTRQYRIEGVPAVVVDGRHLVSPGIAGGFDNMVRILDHLVDKAASESTASR